MRIHSFATSHAQTVVVAAHRSEAGKGVGNPVGFLAVGGIIIEFKIGGVGQCLLPHLAYVGVGQRSLSVGGSKAFEVEHLTLLGARSDEHIALHECQTVGERFERVEKRWQNELSTLIDVAPFSV